MLRFSTVRPLILRDKQCIYFFTRGLSQLDKKQAIEAVIKSREQLKERVTTISTTALTRYYEFIGFDEIERAYQKVTILQEELAKIQGERTKIQMQIHHTAKSLTNIQEQMQDCKRGDAKYIDLMKKGKYCTDLKFWIDIIIASYKALVAKNYVMNYDMIIIKLLILNAE